MHKFDNQLLTHSYTTKPSYINLDQKKKNPTKLKHWVVWRSVLSKLKTKSATLMML
jgi:hypothetical protein